MTKEDFKQYIFSFLGKPYLWGGDTPMSGFDCSGFVIEILKAMGKFPLDDMSSLGLYQYYSSDEISGVPQFGTLLFFGKDKSSITHVTMAISNYYMVEAGGGGSHVKTLQDAINEKAFVRIRPISRRKDLVAKCHPKYPWEE